MPTASMYIAPHPAAPLRPAPAGPPAARSASGRSQRDLVAMRFGAGLPFAQIGTLTGRSEAATKMALRRTLDRLAGVSRLELHQTIRRAG